MFTLRIPALPPSVNHAFVNSPRGRFLAKDAKAFKELVRWTLLADRSPRPKLKGLLAVSLVFYSPRWLTAGGKPRKVDLANLEKLFVDSVFEALGLDDSTIWTLTLHKLDGPEESVISITHWRRHEPDAVLPLA